MASSAIPKTFRDGSISIADGTPTTPLSVSPQFEQGDFSADGLEAEQYAVTAIEARGELVGLRKGARTYPTISLTLLLTEFTDASGGDVLDMIHGRGTDYSARVSTTTAKGDVITLDLTLTIEGTDLGDAGDHSVTFRDVHFTYAFAEAEANTLSLSGTVYGDVEFS